MGNPQVVEALYRAYLDRATGWLTCTALGRETRIPFREGSVVGPSLSIGFGWQGAVPALVQTGRLGLSHLDALWARGEASATDADTLDELNVTPAEADSARVLASIRETVRLADGVRFDAGEVGPGELVSGARVVREAWSMLAGQGEPAFFKVTDLASAVRWELSEADQQWLQGFGEWKQALGATPHQLALLELLTRSGVLDSVPAEEMRRREEEERLRLEAEEQARREEEERLRLEAEEKARREEEEKARREEEERLRLEAEEQARRDAEESARQAAEAARLAELEAQRAAAEAERQRIEALRRAADELAEAEERERQSRLAQLREAETARLRAEEEARLKAEEEARLQAEEEARLKAEEEARLRAEEEARLKAEEEARLKAEEEARLKAEEEARLKAEEEARLKAEEEARLRAEEEARLRAEEEARLKAEEEARLKAEEEARLKAEEEARLRAEEEARLRAEEEARLQAEEEARLKAEEEARLKAEEEARLKAEEEARLKAEEEARLRAEEEARLKAEEEARLKAEEEARLKAEEEARLKAEEEARLKAEEEARLKAEEEARLKAEEEARLKAEEDERARLEQEAREREEEERLLRAAAAARAGAEAEARLREERHRAEEQEQARLMALAVERARVERERQRAEKEKAAAGAPPLKASAQRTGDQQALLDKMNAALRQATFVGPAPTAPPPADQPPPIAREDKTDPHFVAPLQLRDPAPPRQPLVVGGRAQAPAAEGADLWNLVPPMSPAAAPPSGVQSFEEALRRVDTSLEALIGPSTPASLAEPNPERSGAVARGTMASRIDALENGGESEEDARLHRQRLLKRAMENLGAKPLAADPSPSGLHRAVPEPRPPTASPTGTYRALTTSTPSGLNRPIPPPTAADQQLSVQIEARFAQLSRKDHFLTLGVIPTASKDQVKASYLNLAKTFHPDRLPPSLPHLAQKMSAVFEGIREAYETLSDDAQRAAWVASRAPAGQAPVRLSAPAASPAPAPPLSPSPAPPPAPAPNPQAADLLKMAEVFFKKRDYRQAEQHFARAYALDRSASTLASQAWAIYMDPARRPEAPFAKDLMQKALGVDPANDRAHYQLGVIARVEGDMDRAEKHFREAVKTNPKHLEANQELRLIEMRKKKAEPRKGGGGFFG